MNNLSSRERQVITMLIDGHNQKAIASMLDISPKTVHSHVDRANIKLDSPTAIQTCVKYDNGVQS